MSVYTTINKNTITVRAYIFTNIYSSRNTSGGVVNNFSISYTTTKIYGMISTRCYIIELYTNISSDDWSVYLNTNISGDRRVYYSLTILVSDNGRVYLNTDIRCVDRSVYLNANKRCVDWGVYLNTNILYIHLFNFYQYTCGITVDRCITIIYKYSIFICRYTTGNTDTCRSRQRHFFLCSFFYNNIILCLDITLNIYTSTIKTGDGYTIS